MRAPKSHRPGECREKHLLLTGPPCAGKSILCRNLAFAYDFHHVAVDDELCDLANLTPSGPAALVLPYHYPDKFILHLRSRLRAGLQLGTDMPAEYILRQALLANDDPSKVRLVIEGYPFSVPDWHAFRKWLCGPHKYREPNEKTAVIVLHAKKEIAYSRFLDQGGEEEFFEERWAEHENYIGGILQEMHFEHIRRGVQLVQIQEKENVDVQEMVDTVFKKLEKMPTWEIPQWQIGLPGTAVAWHMDRFMGRTEATYWR